MATTKHVKRNQLPVRRDLTCTRGDTLVGYIHYHKIPVTRAPRNLTGCIIVAKGTLADGSPVTLPVVRDDEAGWWQVVVPGETTETWPENLGSYDVTLTDALGVSLTYAYGALGVRERDHA